MRTVSETALTPFLGGKIDDVTADLFWTSRTAKRCICQRQSPLASRCGPCVIDNVKSGSKAGSALEGCIQELPPGAVRCPAYLQWSCVRCSPLRRRAIPVTVCTPSAGDAGLVQGIRMHEEHARAAQGLASSHPSCACLEEKRPRFEDEAQPSSISSSSPSTVLQRFSTARQQS